MKAELKAQCLPTDIETLERTKIIHNLRLGRFDILVGVNLLREGLDLPEVALVAILDADKEGFLRNERSLIQTIGRAARNVDAKVLMYADRMTGSMRAAIGETERRRKIQLAHNAAHGITPQSIRKAVAEEEVVIEPNETGAELDFDSLVIDLEGRMRAAAENLEFETAIEMRDKLDVLKAKMKQGRFNMGSLSLGGRGTGRRGK